MFRGATLVNLDSKGCLSVPTRYREHLGGKYRIVFSHMPNIEDHFGMNWIKPFAELDASLFVTGHLHMVDFIDGEPPIVIGGGKIDGGDDFGVTMLTLHDGKIDIKTVNVDGDILLSKTVDA